MRKHFMKSILAFVPAMFLTLLGMRLFGLITIRNTASDIENFRQILQSPEPHLADIAEIYQYQYNFWRLAALLATLVVVLIICINIRNGIIPKGFRALRRGLQGKQFPDISTLQGRISALIKGLQYGQVVDAKRRYCVFMRVRARKTQQTFLFVAEQSEKPPVMNLSCFDALSAAGEGLVRIIIPKTVLIWKRDGVSLMTKSKAFRVIGEDRATSHVHIPDGEQIAVETDEFVIELALV